MDYEVDAKIPVWEQIVLSITKAGKLIGLSELTNGKFARYVAFISFLLMLLTALIPSAATILSLKGFRNLFENTLPDFVVQDGEIRMDTEKAVKLYLAGMNVIFDTSADTCPKEELSASGMYMTFGKKNIQMFVSDGAQQLEFYNMKVSDLFPDGLNNAMLVQMIPFIYLSFAITFLFVMIGMAIKYLFLAIIYTIFSYPLLRRTGLQMSYGNAFRMAYYAQTLGIMISNINLAFGLIVPSTLTFIVGFIITFSKISVALKPYLADRMES